MIEPIDKKAPQSSFDRLWFDEKLENCRVFLDKEITPPKPIISIAMGNMGRVTRLLGEFTGSAITFASIGKSSAPGQMEIDKVREILDKLEEVL